MPFCFYLKNKLHFPNLAGNLQTLKVAFFPKINFYFYFLSVVRTPLNNCAKHQHPEQKFNIFFEKSQNCFFTFFGRSYKMGPLKKKKMLIAFSMF